ncbi:hypothetical protein [Halanaerobacter jeridensis]|uniref:Uncharacterized protein n=1 Tax=Halanaerobacter jeridensis TaxID=706427 RepID=A0A939BSC2_9FIRM|nr:hypothetical protein [Halanaerobacter jeridensis]MBM7558204.1 hypothetical protein [Halanaerobacter jeridensis]
MISTNNKGELPKYSDKLKLGIADTLNILATFGKKDCKMLDGISLNNKVSYWVKKILNKDLSAKGWYSIRKNLTSLAEAAPESFLESIEKSIYKDEYCIKEIFSKENGFLGGCPHANLLWALEMVSWDLDYLAQVVKILAELSQVDPGGSYTNRPFNSLQKIFLGWTNNTNASYSDLIKIIDAHLIKFYPDVAWKLLISILPKKIGKVSSSIHKPNYRNWAESIEKTANKEDYNEYIEKIVERIIELMLESPKARLIELVGDINDIPDKYLIKCIRSIQSIEFDRFSKEFLLNFVNELRNIISRHREYDETKWSLSKEYINELEEVLSAITLEDTILKNKYLFDEYFPNLINPVDKEKDYKEHEEIIYKHRLEVLNQIYQESGIKGIKRLIKVCGDSKLVGRTIAYSDLKSCFQEEILNWLEKDNKLLIVAQSFITTVARDNSDYVKPMIEKMDSWNKTKKVNLLLALPFNNYIFELLSELDEGIQKEYWQSINHYYFDYKEDLKKINWLIKQLFKNGRPLAAIDATNQALRSSDDITSLNCNLLSMILKEVASNPDKDNGISFFKVKDTILDIIKYIQRAGEISKEEIAQIEWIYLQIFNFRSIQPKFLENSIKNNPDFFVQIVSWIYKSENGEKEDETLDKKIVEDRVDRAWKLLHHISVIPGEREDGSIDFNILREWVLEARKLFEECDRKVIGDIKIGELLSHCSVGNDGIWPHEAVRKIIERIRSFDLESGFKIGKYNSRGVTTRAVFEGGIQEFELAKEYNKQAEEIKFEYPRTSRVLRQLARDYEDQGRREDMKTELID